MGRFLLSLCIFVGLMVPAFAEDAPPVGKPSSEEDVKAALFGGVPGGRWKEGLLFDGISPQPWLKSAANWFPNTEEIQPDFDLANKNMAIC